MFKNNVRTYLGYALLVHPNSLSHALLQLSALGQAIISAYNTRDIIPGITIINIGNTLRKPAKIVPPFAWANDFAPKVR